MSKLQTKVVADLTRPKEVSREYLRSLSPTEKIAKLVELQERYYQMLSARTKRRARCTRTMAEMARGALRKIIFRFIKVRL